MNRKLVVHEDHKGNVNRQNKKAAIILLCDLIPCEELAMAREKDHKLVPCNISQSYRTPSSVVSSSFRNL